MRRGFWLTMCMAAWLGSARADSLRVDASAERMRVDGSLREWKGARFGQLGSGDDAAVRYALATADGGLYLGVEISDQQLVRGKGVGPKQDALVLTLAMPDGRDQWRAVEVWLHAGEPGQSKAASGLAQPGKAPRPEPNIKVVEGPREGNAPGYVIEAFVPWSLIPGAQIWEQGRASLRFEDVDGSAKPKLETTLSSAETSRPSELPRLVLGVGHKDFLGSFLSSKKLVGIEPRFDARGNVYGDAAPERVVIVDRYVVVYGPGYKKGESFGYFQLPIGMGGGLKSAALMDLTGDGRSELTFNLRQRNDLGAREVWMVLSLAEDNPRPLFGVELRKEVSGGFLENNFAIERKGKGNPRIKVDVGRFQGVSPETYREGRASDVQAILLPWGEVSSRTYAYDGTTFAVVDETRREPTREQAVTSVRPSEPAQIDEPVAPSEDAVLALFKKDRKLPASSAPTRRACGNLVGSKREERVFVFGAALVLLGEDIGGGGSYLAYGLPIADPRDLLYVGTADVTGDGLHEIFARVRQPLSGADGVTREVLLILHLDAQSRISRVLAAEVARRQGTSSIANRVVARAGKLIIEPGKAQGWAADAYPFTNEATGGVERLLLPWSDGPVTYRWDGARLVSR